MNKDTRKTLEAQLTMHLTNLADYAYAMTTEDRGDLQLLVRIMTMDSLNRIATQLEDGTISVINPNRD